MKNSFNYFGFQFKNFWTWSTITSKAIHFIKNYAKDFFNFFFMIQNLHDSNLLPTLKKHSKFKINGILILLKFNVCFYNFKSLRVLYNMQI
jgi:hypothetical protein